VKTDKILRELNLHRDIVGHCTEAGLLKQSWARKGINLSFPDVVIAAVAISENLTLITDNVKDFPMPELQLYALPRIN